MPRPSGFFRRTLKVASAAADRWRPHVDGVVILLYHRVGGGTSLEVDLDAARFDEQMATVAASCRPVTLGAGIDELAASESPHAPPPVVITFDDGTADFVDVAVPILVRHQVPATLYLATAFVEEGREFPGGGRPLSWSALRDACSTGLVDIGSHTHTHALLDRAAPGAAAEELERSVDLIGANLGVTARDFAYPKAVAGTPEVAELVRERFRSAALAGTRVNAYRKADPYRLARSPIQVSDGMEYFGRKLAGGMALEDSMRRALNRVRYAKAAS